MCVDNLLEYVMGFVIEETYVLFTLKISSKNVLCVFLVLSFAMPR